MQVQTQVQLQRQSTDASAIANTGAMHVQAASMPKLFPITVAYAALLAALAA